MNIEGNTLMQTKQEDSPNDILLTFMKYLLNQDLKMEEELRLKIYEIVSLSFIRINDGISTLLQLCGCISKINLYLNRK